MKTILTIIMCCLQLTIIQAQMMDTLTNEKVIKLSKLGLEPSILIEKIQMSYVAFDIRADALISLSDNGVDSEVIKEMMRVQNEAAIAQANEKDMSDPLTMRDPGIYYYNPEDKEKPLLQVDATIMANVKSGGFGNALAQRYTMGLTNSKLKSTLAGEDSRLQIQEAQPEFYFYFDKTRESRWNNWLFVEASSPNEFGLVKFKVKRDSREAVIGMANAYGGSSGINNKVKVDYLYEQVAEGIYRVYFEEPLKKGEYCFVYASSTPSRFDNDKVFDFGIE